MGLGVLAVVIARAIGIGDKIGIWTATVVVSELSAEEINFWESLEVCTADTVSINFEFFSKTGRGDGKLLLSDDSGDESTITSLSDKNLLKTQIIGFFSIYTFFRIIWIGSIICGLLHIDFSFEFY